MRKIILSLSLCLFSAVAVAESNLKELSNDELGQVQGQGGADLSLTLSINQAPTTDGSLPNTYQCTNGKDQYCRFAFAANNRNVISGGTTTLQQYWLVAKKFQGTLAIAKFQLDGTTVTTGSNTYHSAVQLTFLDQYPIQIRNFGFQALSLEADSATNGTVSSAQKGYLNTTVPSTYTGFDAGSEKGFMGLNINGNLAGTASLKMFSCNPSATARC